MSKRFNLIVEETTDKKIKISIKNNNIGDETVSYILDVSCKKPENNKFKILREENCVFPYTITPGFEGGLFNIIVTGKYSDGVIETVSKEFQTEFVPITDVFYSLNDLTITLPDDKDKIFNFFSIFNNSNFNIYPNNATNRNIEEPYVAIKEIIPTNPNVISVDALGNIRPLSRGKSGLEIKLNDPRDDTGHPPGKPKITVVQRVTEILTPEIIYVKPGDTIDFPYAFLPVDADNQKVDFLFTYPPSASPDDIKFDDTTETITFSSNCPEGDLNCRFWQKKNSQLQAEVIVRIQKVAVWDENYSFIKNIPDFLNTWDYNEILHNEEATLNKYYNSTLQPNLEKPIIATETANITWDIKRTAKGIYDLVNNIEIIEDFILEGTGILGYERQLPKGTAEKVRLGEIEFNKDFVATIIQTLNYIVSGNNTITYNIIIHDEEKCLNSVYNLLGHPRPPKPTIVTEMFNNKWNEQQIKQGKYNLIYNIEIIEDFILTLKPTDFFIPITKKYERQLPKGTAEKFRLGEIELDNKLIMDITQTLDYIYEYISR